MVAVKNFARDSVLVVFLCVFCTIPHNLVVLFSVIYTFLAFTTETAPLIKFMSILSTTTIVAGTIAHFYYEVEFVAGAFKFLSSGPPNNRWPFYGPHPHLKNIAILTMVLGGTGLVISLILHLLHN